MAWFKMHQELARHPKLKRFARGLGISRPTAIGHLFLLWSWAMDYAQDGDLSQFSEDDIAEAAGWEGDAEKFITEALRCGIRGPGFLENNSDGEIVLHRWDDHMGVELEKRKKEAERLRAYRKKQKQAATEKDNSVHSTYDVRTQYVPSTYAVRGEERRREEREEREERDEKRGKEKRGDETPPPAAVEADIGEKPTPQEGKSKKGKKSKKDEPPPPTPLPDGPFDMKTFMALQEMYWVAPDYVADPGAEIRLIQELTEEYPAVPLFQEFRKARAWLEAHPEKGRKDIRRFLRNWVSKADRQYGTYETVFVPVNEAEGG